MLKNTETYTKKADYFADDIKRQYALYETSNIVQKPNVTVEQYWTTVGMYAGIDGKPCFKDLAALAMHCLIVSHGNAAPERGFSTNKRLLQDRNQLKESTITALRLVKESIELNGGNVRTIPYHFFLPL